MLTGIVTPRRAVLLGLVLTVIGCQHVRTEQRLRATKRPYIADAPEPEGFELVDKLSEDHATSGWRFVRYTYRGPSDQQAALDYYREEMPLNNWTYISRQGLQGRYMLLFEKPNEQCEVTIGPDGSRLFGGGCRVQVIIKPLHRTGKTGSEGSGQ
jgi:hypothetical protein